MLLETLKTMKKINLLLFLLLFLSAPVFAQVFTNKEVGKKNQDLRDSLKTAEYPYVLPILGKKATKAGFSLPYSAGLSVQYLWQKQDLLINNLSVGFNNGPLHSLDEIVRFENSNSEARAINFRPDVWVLPFLNVYGIFAASRPSTSVGFGVWVPDGNNQWQKVFTASTKAEFEATTVGFGVTPTIGVAGGFIALDMNFTWTDVSALEKPAYSFIFDPRFGKTFKLKNKEQNIAFWVGGFRWDINSETRGSIPLSTVLPIAEWNEKVQQGMVKVDGYQQQVDTWWAGLTPIEQNKPSNIAKHDTAERALAAASKFLNGASNAVGAANEGTVQYTLDKAPALKWNFIVGTQFQYSKHWMLRGEYGFLGSREQFFIGTQYRFGL